MSELDELARDIDYAIVATRFLSGTGTVRALVDRVAAGEEPLSTTDCNFMRPVVAKGKELAGLLKSIRNERMIHVSSRPFDLDVPGKLTGLGTHGNVVADLLRAV